jgi:hypothetical protein
MFADGATLVLTRLGLQQAKFITRRSFGFFLLRCRWRGQSATRGGGQGTQCGSA